MQHQSSTVSIASVIPSSTLMWLSCGLSSSNDHPHRQDACKRINYAHWCLWMINVNGSSNTSSLPFEEMHQPACRCTSMSLICQRTYQNHTVFILHEYEYVIIMLLPCWMNNSFKDSVCRSSNPHQEVECQGWQSSIGSDWFCTWDIWSTILQLLVSHQYCMPPCDGVLMSSVYPDWVWGSLPLVVRFNWDHAVTSQVSMHVQGCLC
jgi:hypothetical protein